MWLLVPDLLAPADFLGAVLRDLALPGLQRLLGHARVRSAERAGPPFQRSTPAARWLFAQAGVVAAFDDDAPWAAVLAAHDGIALDARAIAVARPSRFRLARDHVVLDATDLDDPAAARRFELAREWLGDIEAEVAASGRWWLRGEWLARLHTSDPARALGRNVDRWLPVDRESGTREAGTAASASRRWRRLHTELQMAWFAESGEDAPVNALWLHGVSQPLVRTVDPAFDAIVSGARDARWSAFAAWCARPAITATSAIALESSAPLVVLDDLAPCVVAGDGHAFRETLERLDRDWFTPLADQRRSLDLVACGETAWRRYDCTPRRLRFGRGRTLEQVLAA